METKLQLKDLVHWQKWYAKSTHLHNHFRNQGALYSFMKKNRSDLLERGAIRKTPLGVMINDATFEEILMEVL